MRTPPPALLPLLRSRLQGDLLALLFLHPDQEYSLSEAATAIGASVKAVQQEATRLVTAGLITDRRRGNLRLLRAASDSLLSRPLTDMLMLTYGPLPVLSDALAGVAKVEEAVIYGSWAARYQGEPGPIPADVDVLVVGTASMDDLEDAAAKAQEQLRRPVNIRRVRPAAWHDPRPSDPFLASIRSRPLVSLRRRGEERRP
jgi:DNA-binding transcriptional ArsR family regulator